MIYSSSHDPSFMSDTELTQTNSYGSYHSMLAYSITRFSGARIVGGISVVSAVRFLSSKPPKTDDITDGTNRPRRVVIAKNKLKANPPRLGKNDAEVSVRASRKRHGSKGEESKTVAGETAVSTKSPPQSFIPFTKFPKAPDSIMNSTLQELYDTIGSSATNSDTTALSKSKKGETFVDFNIPDKFLKSKIKEQTTDKDRALVEELDNFLKTDDENELAQSQLKMIKLYYDQDTNSFQPLPEHSLKKTLSGMLNLNPNLDDIDDEYLWKLIPKDKIFGVPPFEQKIAPNGFKAWEQEKLRKIEQEKSAREIDVKEFKKFEKQLTNSKSFFKKAGSRKKLDRKLVKKYKKLKQEGKIPKDLSNEDKDNDDLL